jgi:hypothetical protein
VDLIEQPRQALDLVQDHPAFGRQRTQLIGKRRGIGKQPLKKRLVKQIKAPRIRQLQADPCALAHASQAKEEKTRL